MMKVLRAMDALNHAVVGNRICYKDNLEAAALWDLNGCHRSSAHDDCVCDVIDTLHIVHDVTKHPSASTKIQHFGSNISIEDPFLQWSNSTRFFFLQVQLEVANLGITNGQLAYLIMVWKLWTFMEYMWYLFMVKKGDLIEIFVGSSFYKDNPFFFIFCLFFANAQLFPKRPLSWGGIF